MDVITIESQAYKELMAKINTIAKFVIDQSNESDNSEDEWVDSYEVCTFLHVSERTLQRLRSRGEIAYSTIRGRNFYKIGELKRLLESRLIKSSEEHLNDLITNHKLNAQQRRDIKKDK